MDSPHLLTRAAAPLLSLIAVALIAGGAGYALTEPDTRPIPPPEPLEGTPAAAAGEMISLSGDQMTLTGDGGSTQTYTLAPDAPVEVLRPISLEDVSLGDWLNGGAIPHAQTVLALENLILIEDAVEP